MNQRTLWMLVLTAALITGASAQPFVSPAKGQSPERRKSDEWLGSIFRVSFTGADFQCENLV